MPEKLTIQIEVIRTHPAAKDVVEIYSPLIGKHWVYVDELIAAQQIDSIASSPTNLQTKSL